MSTDQAGGERAATLAARSADDAVVHADWSDFKILTATGLVLVGIVAVVLAYAIAMDDYWMLVALHLAGGATWMVLDIFLGFVLGPVLNRLPFPTRISIAKLLLPRMLLLMPTAVTVTLAAGWKLGELLGTTSPAHPRHEWIVASYVIAGILEITALGLLQPANVAVLCELKRPRPDRVIIERLMRRFYGTAKVLAVLQIAMLVIMTRVST